MTPDEYCDTIRGIAFDRETTKAAFEAGRLDCASEHDHDLTIAYMGGHSRGRESLRLELERQEAVAYGYPNTAITGKRMALMMVRLDIPSDDQYGGAQWAPLYAAPPDVRELVHAVEYFLSEHDAPNDTAEALDMLRAAFSKHRSQP
ncbi:MAG: hypothetical protein Q8L99_08340 [Polycyclovorans sp.]|nr:hypothetical protein [Polycyclovorans sp.]